MAHPQLPDGWVCLCVGGTEFVTTRATLENAPGFFSSLFSSSFAAPATDSFGRVLVDRDPEAFPYILSYLRTLDAFVPPSCARLLRVLEREAAFFGLEGLQQQLAERREAEERRAAEGEEGAIVLLSGLPDSAVEQDLIAALGLMEARGVAVVVPV